MKIGWKSVILGQPQDKVEKKLGQGMNLQKYNDVYFIDYPTKGIQVSYNIADNKLHTIYFYNKDDNYEHFSIFSGETSKGINWNSSRKDILDAYGKPKEEYNGEDWRRMEYIGFDFRFKDGVLSRMGIFQPIDKKQYR